MRCISKRRNCERVKRGQKLRGIRKVSGGNKTKLLHKRGRRLTLLVVRSFAENVTFTSVRTSGRGDGEEGLVSPRVEKEREETAD